MSESNRDLPPTQSAGQPQGQPPRSEGERLEDGGPILPNADVGIFSDKVTIKTSVEVSRKKFRSTISYSGTSKLGLMAFAVTGFAISGGLFVASWPAGLVVALGVAGMAYLIHRRL